MAVRGSFFVFDSAARKVLQALIAKAITAKKQAKFNVSTVGEEPNPYTGTHDFRIMVLSGVDEENMLHSVVYRG